MESGLEELNPNGDKERRFLKAKEWRWMRRFLAVKVSNQRGISITVANKVKQQGQGALFK